MSKAVGRGFNKGCISSVVLSEVHFPRYSPRNKASGIEYVHIPLANGTNDGLKTNMYLLSAFLST